MPGTFAVDTAATYTSAIVMATGPKEVFGQAGRQDVTASGEKKWQAQVAVSYHPDPNGIVNPAEVIAVSMVGEDPGPACPPGTAVTFDQLRAGVSAPEQRERKDGNGTRVVGGKLFYSAKAIKPAPAQQSWSKKSDAA
jgi:hypothetical protein